MFIFGTFEMKNETRLSKNENIYDIPRTAHLKLKLLFFFSPSRIPLASFKLSGNDEKKGNVLRLKGKKKEEEIYEYKRNNGMYLSLGKRTYNVHQRETKGQTLTLLFNLDFLSSSFFPS